MNRFLELMLWLTIALAGVIVAAYVWMPDFHDAVGRIAHGIEERVAD